MTHSYRILRNSGDLRIACNGETFTEDELHEAIWHINRELRSLGLTRRERIEAERQIARYGELLAALREAGA